MALGNFHVGGGLWQILSDGADENTDLDYVGLAGLTMTFTSNIPITKTVAVEGGLLIVPQRTVVVQSDGTFKERLPSGELAATAGIDLLANDPELELEDDGQVQWTVTSNSILVGSQMVKLQPWTFDAPAPGWSGTIDELAPVLSVSVTQIIKGDSAYQVAVNNGFEGTQEEWLDSLHDWDDLTGKPTVIAAGPTQADARTAIGAESTAMKGATGGYAPLNNSRQIDATYLPSYVDDVVSHANVAAFPVTGETGKIYVAEDTGDSYRWTGSAYARISDRVTAAGITDSTTVGRAVVTAASELVARTAISAVGKGELVVSVMDHGAAGDGVADDTAEIHAARDAAGAGGRVWFPAGTYLVDGLTASVAGQSWELAPGATVKMKTGAEHVLSVTGDGVTVTGGAFDCSNGTAHDWSQHGVLVSGDDVTIRGASITDSPKLGIYALNASGITVTGCTIVNSWNTGIFVQNTLTAPSTLHGVLIADNIIDNSEGGDGASGIGVLGTTTTQKISGITVSRNTIRLPYSQPEQTAGIGVFFCEDWSIDGNLISGGWASISSPAPVRARVSNNLCRGFWKYGIELPGDTGAPVNDCSVIGNTVDPDGVTTAEVGISIGSVGGSNRVSVIGNTIGGFPVGPCYHIAVPSGTHENLTVTGNAMRSQVSSGSFYGFNSTGTLENFVFSGNVVDAGSTSGSYGMTFNNSVEGATFTANAFANLAQRVAVFGASGTTENIYFGGNTVVNCASPPLYFNSGALSATNFVTDLTVQPVSGTSPAKAVAMRDSSNNLTADAFIPALTSTATASGTTTLTADSSETQLFTGATTQTCQLPTTSVVAGRRFTIANTSTGAVTVTASGGATVAILATGASGVFTALQATPTGAAHWSYNLGSPSIASPTLSGTVTGTYTLGGTPTFPSTVVTTTGAQELTGKTMSGANNTFSAIPTSALENTTLIRRSIATLTAPAGLGSEAATDYVALANLSGTYESDSTAGHTVALLHGGGSNGSTTLTDSGVLLSNWTPVGDAQISTAQSKFGGSSIYFDGSGDWILPSADSSHYAFGSSDWTIEMWIYPTDLTTQHQIYDGRTSGVDGAYPTIYIGGGGTLYYYTDSAARITGSAPTINTWSHLAVCRAAGVTRMFLNGTQVGSSYTDGNVYVNAAARPAIGARRGADLPFQGYMDDIRISRYARYTDTFTPHASAHPDPAVVKLPTAAANTNRYTVGCVGAQAVVLANSNGQAIDGAATKLLAAGETAYVVSDGTNWRTVGVAGVTRTGAETLSGKTLSSPALITPDIGTPSAGTLTNCTGLPVSGISASTSTALGVGSVEVGHASDTTVSRSAAGVLAVEGNPVAVRVSVPSTATDAGKPGYWAADSSHVYTYTGDGSTHTWVRATAASW